MLQNALDFVSPQEDKLSAATNATNKPCDDKENVDPNLQQKMSFLCGKTQEKRGLIKTIKKKENLAWQVTQGETQAQQSCCIRKQKSKGMLQYDIPSPFIPKLPTSIFFFFCNRQFFYWQQQKKRDDVEPQAGVEKLRECNAMIS